MSLYIYIKIDHVIITLDVVSVGSRISSVSIAKNNDDEMHPIDIINSKYLFDFLKE
mgnify:FL=1